MVDNFDVSDPRCQARAEQLGCTRAVDNGGHRSVIAYPPHTPDRMKHFKFPDIDTVGVVLFKERNKPAAARLPKGVGAQEPTLTAHKVWFRFIARPEKWRAGVATSLSLPRANDSHHSSSTIRSGATPQYSRWEPTPKGMINITFDLASSRMVG